MRFRRGFRRHRFGGFRGRRRFGRRGFRGRRGGRRHMGGMRRLRLRIGNRM